MLQPRLIGMSRSKFFPAMVRWSHSGPAVPGSGKFFKRFTFAVVGVSAVSAAALTYAFYDADFRRALESVHPTVPGLIKRAEEALPENLNFHQFSTAIRQKFDGASLSFLPGIFKREETADVVRDPSPPSTDAKETVVVQDSVFLSECDRIEKFVHAAVSAKKKVIETAKQRQKLLQKYIDDHATGDDQNLRRSYSELEQDVQAEKSANRRAEDSIKNLQSLLTQTQRSIFTSPSTAQTEAGNRLKAWCDELGKADAEMKVAMKFENMHSEYVEIAEDGRARYQKELKTVFPHIQSQDDLSDEELIALLAQAYVRLQMAESYVKDAEEREKTHLNKMLSQQAIELSNINEQKMIRMKNEIYQEKEKELQRHLKAVEEQHEEDLKKRLKQQAAAHSEHLKDSLKHLEQRLEADHKRQIEARLMRQAEAYYQRMDNTLNTVMKINDVLDSRADHDKLVHRSRRLLGISKNLRDTIIVGPSNANRRRLKPLANDILQIRDEFNSDDFVKTLLDSIPDQAVYYGVCNEQDLKERFRKVYRLCKRAAFMDESGGGLIRYLVSIGLSVFLVEPEVTVKPDDEIDLNKNVDTMNILCKADYCISHNDFPTAIRLLNLLRGQPGLLASLWIRDATHYAETLQIAQDLVSYANALTLRVVY